MDDDGHCDRIAIGRWPDRGPRHAQALKAAIGTDRVRLEIDDTAAAAAAIKRRFALEASTVAGALVLQVPDGEHFVPKLLADLGVPVRSVKRTRPTLDDVFMNFTGRTIRDAESAPGVGLGPTASPVSDGAHQGGGGFFGCLEPRAMRREAVGWPRRNC